MRNLLILAICSLGWMSFMLYPEGKDLPKLEVSANKHYLTVDGDSALINKNLASPHVKVLEADGVMEIK